MEHKTEKKQQIGGRPQILANAVITVRKDWIAWLMIAPSVLFFILFSWQPIIMGIVTSFFKTTGFQMVSFVGLDNYISVIEDSQFLTTVINTMSYTLWSLVIGALLPIIAAIFLNEMVVMKGYFRLALFFPGMVPAIAASLMWGLLFDPSDGGVLNTLLSMLGLPASQWLNNPSLTIPLIVATMTWQGFGSTAILYLADLQSVNQDLYEAAALDGAGVLRRIRHVTLPHLSGLIKMMLIMQIIGVFKVYVEPLAMTGGGPHYASYTLSMLTTGYAFQYFRADKAAAVGVLMGIMLSIFTVLYFRMTKSRDTTGGAA